MHWIIERVRKTKVKKKKKRSKSLDETEKCVTEDLKMNEKTKSLPSLPVVVLEIPSPEHKQIPSQSTLFPGLSRAASARSPFEMIGTRSRMEQNYFPISRSMRDFYPRQNTIAGSTAFSRTRLNQNVTSYCQSQLCRSLSCRSPHHELSHVCHPSHLSRRQSIQRRQHQPRLNMSQMALYSPTFFRDFSEPSSSFDWYQNYCRQQHYSPLEPFYHWCVNGRSKFMITLKIFITCNVVLHRFCFAAITLMLSLISGLTL